MFFIKKQRHLSNNIKFLILSANASQNNESHLKMFPPKPQKISASTARLLEGFSMSVFVNLWWSLQRSLTLFGGLRWSLAVYGGLLWSSADLGVLFRSLVVFDGVWWSLAVFGCLQLSLVIFGGLWWSLVILAVFGGHQQYLVVLGGLRQSLFAGLQWSLVVFSGIRRSLVVSGLWRSSTVLVVIGLQHFLVGFGCFSSFWLSLVVFTSLCLICFLRFVL